MKHNYEEFVNLGVYSFQTPSWGPVWVLDHKKREIRMKPYPYDEFLKRCRSNPRIIHPHEKDIRSLDMVFSEWRSWKEIIESKV